MYCFFFFFFFFFASLVSISTVITTPGSLFCPVLYTGNPNSAGGVLLCFCFSAEGSLGFVGCGPLEELQAVESLRVSSIKLMLSYVGVVKTWG